MTLVAPRIVNDVSYVKDQSGVILCSTEKYWSSTLYNWSSTFVVQSSTGDSKICPKKAHKQQVWARVKYYIYRNSALRSTLNTNVITGLGMCKVLCMYRSSALLSTLNRNVVTGYGLV